MKVIESGLSLAKFPISQIDNGLVGYGDKETGERISYRFTTPSIEVGVLLNEMIVRCSPWTASDSEEAC